MGNQLKKSGSSETPTASNMSPLSDFAPLRFRLGNPKHVCSELLDYDIIKYSKHEPVISTLCEKVLNNKFDTKLFDFTIRQIHFIDPCVHQGVDISYTNRINVLIMFLLPYS